jgi:hypothetical protein
VSGPGALAASRPAAPERIREELRQVLSRREFRARRAAPGAWLAEFLRKLPGKMRGFFRGLRRVHPVIFWLMLAWLVATAVAILGHLAVQLHSTLRGSGTRRRRPPPESREADRLRRLDPEGLLAEAESAASDGRFLDGVARLYLALLARLSRAGAIMPGPGKTNWDYVREFGRRHDAAPLAEFSTVMDGCTYGRRPCDRGVWERCRDWFHRTVELAGAR